jgi:hypothetical protein
MTLLHADESERERDRERERRERESAARVAVSHADVQHYKYDALVRKSVS